MTSAAPRRILVVPPKNDGRKSATSVGWYASVSFQAMAWASEQTTGSASRKAVLYALANHANSSGYCRLRVETICAEAELGPTAVKRILGHLTEVGLLDRERRRRGDGRLSCYDFQLRLGTSGDSGLEPDGDPGLGTRGDPHEPGRSSEPEVHPPIAPQRQLREQVEAVWSDAEPLIRHRASYFSDRKTQAAIDRALAVYPVEVVTAAIWNYATVLGGDEYRWSHSWTLIDFLKRGLDRFVPEARPLENFRIRSNGQKFGRRDVSARELLDLADRLDTEADERRSLEPG